MQHLPALHCRLPVHIHMPLVLSVNPNRLSLPSQCFNSLIVSLPQRLQWLLSADSNPGSRFPIAQSFRAAVFVSSLLNAVRISTASSRWAEVRIFDNPYFPSCFNSLRVFVANVHTNQSLFLLLPCISSSDELP